MTGNVLPSHFLPSQASSSQSSNVDNFQLYCKVYSLQLSYSESSLYRIQSQKGQQYIEALMASANTKALPKLDYRTFIVLFCPQDKCFYRFFFSSLTICMSSHYNLLHKESHRPAGMFLRLWNITFRTFTTVVDIIRK